jgi:hypothetical protein
MGLLLLNLIDEFRRYRLEYLLLVNEVDDNRTDDDLGWGPVCGCPCCGMPYPPKTLRVSWVYGS